MKAQLLWVVQTSNDDNKVWTLRMLEDESLYEFHANLSNIKSQVFAFSDEYPNAKESQKVFKIFA